jgi:protein-S-isoprenylcysteine O-methyltransferase Ste14
MTNLSFIVLTNVQLIGIVVAVVVVVAVVLILAAKAQKSRRLRSRFGPEYSRAVQESGRATCQA